MGSGAVMVMNMVRFIDEGEGELWPNVRLQMGTEKTRDHKLGRLKGRAAGNAVLALSSPSAISQLRHHGDGPHC